jgi:tetratricopeptide (TPR) repeat protein
MQAGGKMSGGQHFSFPPVFSPGIVGTKKPSTEADVFPQPCGDTPSGLPLAVDDVASSKSVQEHCGNLGIPRQLVVAQGYLELATGPASRLGLAPKLRRQTLRQVFSLAVNCRVQKCHQPARHLLIGQALRLLGKYRGASDALRKASSDRCLRRDALLGLAWCQKRLGLLEDAIATVTRALAASPNDADLHYNLACYLALAMQPRAAIYELAWALELKPRLRQRASVEPDFDPLRCFEAFAALTDRTPCKGSTWSGKL